MAKALSSNSGASSGGKEFNYFVKRLKQMNQDLVCLDSVSGKLSIYSGGTTLIHSIDPTRLFQSMPTTPLGFRTIGLSNSSGSSLQLHLSDGSQKRITLRFELSDFVVISILKILRKILPQSVYSTIIKDTLGLFCQVKE